MLTLRLIDPNDYEVRDDGQRIGRIRYARERSPGTWIWSVNVTMPGSPSGSASSLDEAKERFKSAWLAFAAKHGPEKLARAYEAMNHANRPDRYSK